MASVIIAVLTLVVLAVTLMFVKCETFQEETKQLTIMQTHKYPESQIPDRFKEAWDSWKNQRGCSYVYFDNAVAGRRYLLDNLGHEYLRAFDDIVPGAYKADFFRYCWLYKEGGVYADFDSVALISVRDWLTYYPDVDMILARDDPVDRKALYQAFIYCKRPGNPLLAKCIEMIMANIRDAKAGKTFSWSDFTGPKLVYNALCALEPRYAGLDVPADILDTSFGKLMILSWALPALELVDNRARRITRHRCSACYVEDDHYSHLTSTDYVVQG
jgi:hypothetical protein